MPVVSTVAAPVADERTLGILDFPAVLERLADRCASPLGRARALALRPSARRRQVEIDLAEADEARALCDLGNAPPLDGLHDVTATVERAARGALLSAADIWAVGETAACIGRLKEFLAKRAAAAPLLADWASGLADFGDVAAEVTRCLLPDGDVLDRASPALAAGRQAVRRLEGAIRDKLEELVRSASLQGALQEPLVTQRRDRFVLPVKADSRGLVRGLLHDQSASGATVFIEPLAVVDLGNQLRAAQSAVEHEILRILTALSALCGRDAYDWARSLDAAAHLDFCAAKGKLSADWDARAPELTQGPTLDLHGARHPLIARAVPVDIRVGLDFDALVLTGPNTGGKTVSLKIAGLLVCLAQSGLHLPVGNASRVGVFPRVCGAAGDEQGVAQSLSTFSSHMRAVVAAVAAAVPGALVLLDELGAGTDPGEGAALAMALLEHLLEAGARVIVTTHYSELKAFAYRTARAENGSVSFDPETLQPTYRLVIGVPGPSQAFAIAARLGLPGPIVARARGMQRPEERHVETMIAGMAADERRLREAAAQADAEHAAAAAVRRELEEERAAQAAKRAAELERARQEAATVLAEARREADALLRELRRLAEQAGTAGALEAGVATREQLRVVTERLTQRPAAAVEAPARHFHAGQPVRIKSLDREGVLVAPPTDGNAVVQAGALRLNVPLEDLAPAAPPQPARAPRPGTPLTTLLRAAPVECDLRGLHAADALPRVDKALDDAVLGGAAEIRLIHGKGTGALREAVGEFLRGHPQVAGFRLGGPGEGGDGATVVAIRG